MTATRPRWRLPGITDRAFLDAPYGRLERWILLALLLTVVVLKVVWTFRQGFDTDEAQHLHVAWAWTQGQVQYRDVFDNHTPLFHLLMAPFVAAVGERGDVLTLARFVMLPCFLGLLWVTASLGTTLFGRRVGAWAAVWLGWEQQFFHKTIEVRADVPWALAWCLALLVLVRGRLGVRRAFAVGLLMGVAGGLSLKTALLLVGLGAACASLPLVRGPGNRVTWRRLLDRRALAWAVGLAVVPALVVAGFALAGGWSAMLECLVTNNLGASPQPAAASSWWTLLGGATGLGALVLLLFRWNLVPGDRRRQWIVVVGAGLSLLILVTIWRFPRRQDTLPIEPLVVLALVALALHAAVGLEDALTRERAARRGGAPPPALGAATLLVGLGAYVAFVRLPLPGRPYDHATREAATVVQETLRLTDPGQFVLDAKGETIFRPRATYYVLETFVRERLARGRLADTMAEDVVRNGACVAVTSLHRFPPRARAFVEAHYVPVGTLRAAGAWLAPTADDDGALGFETVVPARYVVLSASGLAAGTLDGAALVGARALAPGLHRFVPADGAGPFVALWAQAHLRGFTPFGPPPSRD